jgi:hypothetical protein
MTQIQITGIRLDYASFLEDFARCSDLAEFEKVYTPCAADQNVSIHFPPKNILAKFQLQFTVVYFNGELNDQLSDNDSGEANLHN